MAKIRDLKVKVKKISAFTEDESINIVALVLDVLQDQKMLFFELVKQPSDKEWFINQVKKLWADAEDVCCKFEARQLLKKIKEVTPNKRNEKVLLRDVIAAYVAFNRSDASSKLDEVVKQLKRQIATPEMVSPFFKAEAVVAARPQEWPVAKGNYLTPEQAPYLKQLVEAAQFKGFKPDYLTEAWGKMLRMKSEKVDEPNGYNLSFAEALHCMFSPLSYYETKQHYCAFLTFVNEK